MEYMEKYYCSILMHDWMFSVTVDPTAILQIVIFIIVKNKLLLFSDVA